MNSRLVDHAQKSLSPLKNKVAKQRKIFKSPLIMILNSVLIWKEGKWVSEQYSINAL